MTTYTKTDSDNIDFQKLVSHLDADLAIRDGDQHGFYDQFNKIHAIRHVIVCYHNDTPIGCGALKAYDKQRAEIKRMFVLLEFRGQGIAFSILQALESWARELQYEACILETGKKQPEAIQLYKKAGYQKINNYGQYENIENSVCMSKLL